MVIVSSLDLKGWLLHRNPLGTLGTPHKLYTSETEMDCRVVWDTCGAKPLGEEAHQGPGRGVRRCEP